MLINMQDLKYQGLILKPQMMKIKKINQSFA